MYLGSLFQISDKDSNFAKRSGMTFKIVPNPRPQAAYGLCDTPFGKAVIGICEDCVCWLSFESEPDEFIEFWGDAVKNQTLVQKFADRIFADETVGIMVTGTPFQINVWKALMRVKKPLSYTELATMAGMPKAVRSVATAVGKNNISYIIPCHRIVRSDGSIGQYRWGSEIKAMILEAERGGKIN